MDQRELNDRLYNASKEGDINKVKEMIERGADINHGNNLIIGKTPLIVASEFGYLDIVKYLIEQGANVNLGNNYGKTPLFYASFEEYLDIVKYLTEHGANVNLGNNHEDTPLLLASKRGNLEMVKYLTEHGANVNQANDDEYTPLTLATRKGHLEVIRYLIEHGADYSKFKNNPKFIKLFNRIIKDETNKLRSELTQNYLTLERSTPQTITGEGKVKSSIPRNLLLKTIYEKPYQEYCSTIDGNLPPIQLIAIANILKLDYTIDITWLDLCDKVKGVLYLLL